MRHPTTATATSAAEAKAEAEARAKPPPFDSCSSSIALTFGPWSSSRGFLFSFVCVIIGDLNEYERERAIDSAKDGGCHWGIGKRRLRAAPIDVKRDQSLTFTFLSLECPRSRYHFAVGAAAETRTLHPFDALAKEPLSNWTS